MTGCSAISCSNRSEQGFCMKAFPRDPTLRALWKLKVRRKNWEPTNHAYLCEVHFEANQFEKTIDGRKKFKKNAVPTIFSFSTPKQETSLNREEAPNLLESNSQEDHPTDKDAVILNLQKSLEKANSFIQSQNDQLLKLQVSLESANSVIESQDRDILTLKNTIKILLSENHSLGHVVLKHEVH